MRTSYSAGRLALGCWDHWVPGANDTLTKICSEWGETNHVEVHIDYITSVGDKDLLTASAEAQAHTGHDIMQPHAWPIAVHREVLEPTDDVLNALIKDHGPISQTSDYVTSHEGKWNGDPTLGHRQVHPYC